MPRMNRNVSHDLSQTRGKKGLAPLPAAYDPEPEDDDDITSVADASDLASRQVDGEPTALHLALLDAIAGATTWREPEDDDVADDSLALGLQIAPCGRSVTVLTVDGDGRPLGILFGAAATTPDDEVPPC